MEESDKTAAINAVNLVVYHARVVWIAFGTLLAANSFFVTLAAAIFTIFPAYAPAARVVGVVGALICVAWILIIMRQSDYLHYYYACLRHVEATALPENLRFACIGLKLSDGQPVNNSALPAGGFRLRWGSRLFKVEWLMYFVILVFLLLYTAVVFAPAPSPRLPFQEISSSTASNPSPNFSSQRTLPGELSNLTVASPRRGTLGGLGGWHR